MSNPPNLPDRSNGNPSVSSIPSFPNIGELSKSISNMIPAIPNVLGSFGQGDKDSSFELVASFPEEDRRLDFGVWQIAYLTSKYQAAIKDEGCYVIMMQSSFARGPTAVFCLCKSHRASLGVVSNICSMSSVDGDVLDVVWRPFEYPLVLFRMGSAKRIDYNKLKFRVRVLAV